LERTCAARTGYAGAAALDSSASVSRELFASWNRSFTCFVKKIFVS
jgi:hypothetical protein